MDKPDPRVTDLSGIMKNALDIANAPTILFDNAPAWTGTEIFCIPLTVVRLQIVDGSVAADQVVVANLRCSPTAALNLRHALNALLDSRDQPQGEPN